MATKRDKAKYPNLKPELNLKSRYELIDFDYLDKLSPDEMKFLDKFSEEYFGARFRKCKVHSKKKPNGKTPKPRKPCKECRKLNLQKSKKMRKDCTDRNNARNRDILTRAKASGSYVSIEEVTDPDVSLAYGKENRTKKD